MSDEPKVMRSLPGGGVEIDFDAFNTVYDAHLAENREFEEWSPPSLAAPAGQWRTQDGRSLSIVEMDDAHIRSAVGLFTRFGQGGHAKVEELRREHARRVSDGVRLTLRALTDSAWTDRNAPHWFARARAATSGCETRQQKVDALAEYVRSVIVSGSPAKPELVLPPLLEEPPSKETDDACLLLATLLFTLGIRCRLVAYRYERSWTRRVDYEAADRGVDPWETVWRPDQEPDERIVGPVPEGAL